MAHKKKTRPTADQKRIAQLETELEVANEQLRREKVQHEYNIKETEIARDKAMSLSERLEKQASDAHRGANKLRGACELALVSLEATEAKESNPVILQRNIGAAFGVLCLAIGRTPVVNGCDAEPSAKTFVGRRPI